MTLVVPLLCISVAGIPGQFGGGGAHPTTLTADRWLAVMAEVPESVPLSSLVGESSLDPQLAAVLAAEHVDSDLFVRSSRLIMQGCRWSAPSIAPLVSLDSMLSQFPELVDVEIPDTPEPRTPRPDQRAADEMMRRLDNWLTQPPPGDR